MQNTISVSVNVDAPLASRLYRGLMERCITTESQGLKRRCESAAPKTTGAGAIDPGNR